MKKYFLIPAVSLFLLILLSCEALPVNYTSAKSWFLSSGKAWTTLKILSVQVDRSGGWDSIEKEIASLAPLYFLDSGCKAAAAEDAPSYAARIYIREREFNVGWKTKKSLAVEVHIWDYEDAPKNGETALECELPVAVGRIVVTGDKSFSSSVTAGRYLSKAIKTAAKKLAVYEKEKR